VSKQQEHTERSESGPPPRQAYVSPELVEYGSVAKLTQTGGMTTIDFFFNLRRMGM
jgi:hypothetical protein